MDNISDQHPNLDETSNKCSVISGECSSKENVSVQQPPPESIKNTTTSTNVSASVAATKDSNVTNISENPITVSSEPNVESKQTTTTTKTLSQNINFQAVNVPTSPDGVPNNVSDISNSASSSRPSRPQAIDVSCDKVDGMAPTISLGNTNMSVAKESSHSVDNKLVQRATSLASFVIDNVVNTSAANESWFSNRKPKDKVEETLLRSVTQLMTKHEIVFRAMMKRLDINKETGYPTFVGVANELFENEKKVVTWGRIVALYAFAAQLALHCKEKNYTEYGKEITMFVGKYLGDVASPFITQQGGWDKLAEEFRIEDDLGEGMWKFLTWTAVGLGLATATMFFASSHS